MKATSTLRIRLKNAAVVAAVPLIVFFVMEIFTITLADTHIFSYKLDWINLMKTTSVATCAALALSINLLAGRMDFSLGGQQMIACIIGGNIGVSLGLGPVGLMLFCIGFGILSGLLVGTAFVFTRVPSMVLGIGMALVYECIAFAFSVNGFQLYGKPGLALLGKVQFEVGTVLIMLAIVYVVFGFTKFGYNYKSIRGSQKIAVSMGINVFKNCLVSYGIAGGIMAIAGVFQTSYTGVMSSSMGLSSIQITFSALLAFFVGKFLLNYVDISIAMLVGALTVRIFSAGLGVLSLPDPAVSAINYVCMLLFLIYQGVSQMLTTRKSVHARKEEAAGNKVLA